MYVVYGIPGRNVGTATSYPSSFQRLAPTNASATTATRPGLSQNCPSAAFSNIQGIYRVGEGLAPSVHEVFGVLTVPRVLRNPQDFFSPSLKPKPSTPVDYLARQIFT